MVSLLKSIGKGRTMIIIDHDIDSLFELVQRVAVQEGRVLVEGTPSEIKGNEVQEAYLAGVARGRGPLERQPETPITGIRISSSTSRCASSATRWWRFLRRDGAGKSTNLKSLMGVVTPRSGSIRFDSEEIAGKKSSVIARAGMQLVHEDRRIFGSLNVGGIIILAGLSAPARWPLERVYTMFPRLKERRASRGTDLSGGEQQMLAIARALVREPNCRRAVRRFGADHRAQPSRHLRSPPRRGRRYLDRQTEYLRGDSLRQQHLHHQ